MVKPNWIVDSVAADKLLSCKFMDLFLHLPFFLNFMAQLHLTTKYQLIQELYLDAWYICIKCN